MTPYQLARSEIGTREIRGSRHNPKVVQYFADVGHDEIDDDETAWCAAALGSWLERSGIKSTGQLTARSYINWGDKVSSLDMAEEGDVVVFWRESPRSWKGHVGFYVKHDDSSVTIVSGNQANAVTEADFPRRRLLGIRRARVSASPVSETKFSRGVLEEIAPRGREDLLEALPGLLNMYLPQYKVTTPKRIALFLANVMAETGGLKIMEENMNYSAKRMTQVWPKRFPTISDALPYARNPEKLANNVYNRYGNRDISGAGWKYRGRGFLQTTFIDNYKLAQKVLKKHDLDYDLVKDPDLLLKPKPALLAALAFWNHRDCNQSADEDDLEGCRRKINGGLIGYKRMLRYYKLILPLVMKMKLDGAVPTAVAVNTGTGTTATAIATQVENGWIWGLGLVVASLVITVAVLVFRQQKVKNDVKKLLEKIDRLEDLHSERGLDMRSDPPVDRTGFDESAFAD